MSDESFTGITTSFRPGGTGYDSPLVVIRGEDEAEVVAKLGGDPASDDLATAVAEYHAKLRERFEAVVNGGTPQQPPAAQQDTQQAASSAPIWQQGGGASAQTYPMQIGSFTVYDDGTFSCPHSPDWKREPFKGDKTNKSYLNCSKKKGEPGRCANQVMP